MGWLASLIFGGAAVGSAVKCGLENMDCMGTPWHVCDDGTKIYKDRVGKCFCEGEYCVFKRVSGFDGLVGTRTGRVYWSAAKDRENRIARENKERIERAKARGDLAYERYDGEKEKYILTELLTGKEIVSLICFGDGMCKKWYRTPGKSEENFTDGIEINREEFINLKAIGGSRISLDLSGGKKC